MATLTVVPGDKTAEIGEGTTLLAAIQSLGITLATNDCGGNAQCGTCHIFVQEGRKGVSKTTKAENEKLDTIVGVGSKSRLACQAKVLGTENIKVEILGFDSGR
jgi:ferredoxin, 2Fe-2S